MTLLVVEDDAVIAQGLVYALAQEGYTVKHAGTVAAARRLLSEMVFDLAVIDMQLPDGDGYAVSETAMTGGTQVIFLTVMDDEDRIVRAFDQGAADYVTKPFRLRELLARLAAPRGRARGPGAAAARRCAGTGAGAYRHGRRPRYRGRPRGAADSAGIPTLSGLRTKPGAAALAGADPRPALGPGGQLRRRQYADSLRKAPS